MAAKRKTRLLAFDVETTGLRPWAGDRIFSYCIADVDGNVDVVRTSQHPHEPLQKLLDDRFVIMVCHNLKFELGMLVANGYQVPFDKPWHDTMIQWQLTNNLRPFDALDYIAWELCGWSRKGDQEIARLGRAYGGYQKIPEPKMRRYQIDDGQRTMLIHLTLFSSIEKDQKLLCDYENEIELIKTTMFMEKRGMLLLRDNCKQLLTWLERELDQARLDCIEVMCEEFNLSSDRQVAYILFQKLGYRPIAVSPKTGKPLTDKTVLDELEKQKPHPIFDIIDRWRSYRKSIGIVTGYEREALGGVLHPNIKTNHAATGREACEKPNLQNVSAKDSGRVKHPVPARTCFGPRPGYDLLSVDQSGIEIRLMIEAGDCIGMKSLMREGKHPHVVFCEIMYGDLWRGKTESAELYKSGKGGHFALCYGADLPKLALTLGLDMEQTRRGYIEYAQRFPELAYLNKSGMRRVIENGCKVVTPFGRTLRIPADKAHSWLNYYIQGTAAGIIKRGQVQCFNALRKRDVYLLLSVHDEIVFEVSRRENLLDVCHIIHTAMISIDEIETPLDVEFKLHRNDWNAGEEVRL